MLDKRPIDIVRESGGQFDVGTKDEGAIIDSVNIGKSLLIIKENAIYELITADNVDPQRTNIQLPKMITRLIANKGTLSETISRTLLTAISLFKPEYILKSIDCHKILVLVIELQSEILVLDKEIKDYFLNENKASEEFEERNSINKSFEIPSIVNLETNCKTIFQKADHVEQTLMEIIINFFPNMGLSKQSHFPSFHKKLIEKYGENDSFSKFINETLSFMQIIRELRNGFDHRLKHTKVFDFELQPEGNIIWPTIELSHKTNKLERMSLKLFLEDTLNNFLDIIELTFAHLAGKNIKSRTLPIGVKEIPYNKRKNKFVRFSLWSPLGPEGFFIQK